MAQLALLYLMRNEMQDISDLEWERFKMALVANNPGDAKRLLEALEAPEEVSRPGSVLNEEGFAEDEKDFMISQLRMMGFVVQND